MSTRKISARKAAAPQSKTAPKAAAQAPKDAKAPLAVLKAAVIKAAKGPKASPAAPQAPTAPQAESAPTTTADAPAAATATTDSPTTAVQTTTPYQTWKDVVNKCHVSILDSENGGRTTHDCGGLEDAQRIYRRLQNGANGNLGEATFYSNGLKVATINKRGVAIDLKGAILADAPSLEDARTAIGAKAEALEPAQAVILPGDFLAAALQVAAKKDEARPYLNCVYLHQVGDQFRVVAGDGHRLLVMSTSAAIGINWGEKGLLLNRADLDRISKFINKGEAQDLEVSYGPGHLHAIVREIGGIATFTLTPNDHPYVQYQRVLDGVKAFNGGERRPTEATCINPAYMKAAGAVAAVLESTGVFAFMDDADGPCAFTFDGVPGAILLAMPMKPDPAQKAAALPAATVRLLSDGAIKGSIAALKAHATRIRKQIDAMSAAAKGSKNPVDQSAIGKLAAQERGFLDRASELASAMSARIEHKGGTKVTTVPDAGKEAVASK